MSLATVFWGLLGTLGMAWLSRDGYACLPRVQRLLMAQAARFFPESQRAEEIEQWAADLADLWPSEIIRTLMAFDLIRGALLQRFEGQRVRPKKSGLPAAAKIEVRWENGQVLGEITVPRSIGQIFVELGVPPSLRALTYASRSISKTLIGRTFMEKFIAGLFTGVGGVVAVGGLTGLAKATGSEAAKWLLEWLGHLF